MNTLGQGLNKKLKSLRLVFFYYSVPEPCNLYK